MQKASGETPARYKEFSAEDYQPIKQTLRVFPKPPGCLKHPALGKARFPGNFPRFILINHFQELSSPH